MQTELTTIARKSARIAAIPLACAAALAGLGAAAPLSAQTNLNPVVSTPLDGATGGGNFTAVVNAEEGQICYMLNAHGLEGVTGASIAQAGSANAVVNLQSPASGASGACQPIDAATASAIAANPGSYEVRVTTQTLPQGAIKGTLTQ